MKLGVVLSLIWHGGITVKTVNNYLEAFQMASTFTSHDVARLYCNWLMERHYKHIQTILRISSGNCRLELSLAGDEVQSS